MIDIATGQQPIFNDDKSVALVFNGEVYNYLELMDELRGHGLRVPHQERLEAIVRAWEHWGEDCVCITCAACSPSWSMTGGATASSWPATAWGSSRCTTR